MVLIVTYCVSSYSPDGTEISGVSACTILKFLSLYTSKLTKALAPMVAVPILPDLLLNVTTFVSFVGFQTVAVYLSVDLL